MKDSGQERSGRNFIRIQDNYSELLRVTNKDVIFAKDLGMELEKLFEELRFSSVIESAVQKALSESKKQICEISGKAYKSEGVNFPLCEYAPLTRLSVVTELLMRKYDEYQLKGVSERIIFDTFRDVSLRADFFLKKTGKIGISREDVIWFRHLMNVDIFKIGVLQYQPFKMLYLDERIMGEPYMVFSQEQRDSLPEGVSVLNCHIQRGANLREEAVGHSLEEAKAFFAGYFPEIRFRGFLCYSWLLYPPMVKSLPEESNIRRFAGRFPVIGMCGDAQQAMENLFEGRGSKILYRDATSLQKTAMESPELFGYACGFKRMV